MVVVPLILCCGYKKEARYGVARNGGIKYPKRPLRHFPEVNMRHSLCGLLRV